jgi:hypothetical protein
VASFGAVNFISETEEYQRDFLSTKVNGMKTLHQIRYWYTNHWGEEILDA